MTDRRILIVAHRTAASPRLLAAVAERAARGPCRFTLLVPRPYWDPDTEEAAITLELAIPLLDAAAGSHVQGIVGAPDPYEAVRQTLEREKYDEVIVSTLPERVSRWLRLDLAHRIERFGVPVSVVTAEQAERALSPGAGAGWSTRRADPNSARRRLGRQTLENQRFVFALLNGSFGTGNPEPWTAALGRRRQ
jgi:hypothetical protein